MIGSGARSTVIAGLLFAATAIGSSNVSAADKITLRLHHFNSPVGGAHLKFLKPWSERINAKADGKMEIKVYPAMQLGGKSRDLYNQARDGFVDMIWTVPGYTANRFPKTEVFSLPFIPGNAEQTSQAYYEFAGMHLADEYADTVPVMYHVSPSTGIYSTKPIVKLEDLEGMKLRAPGRGAGAGFKEIGARAIGMPMPQVPEALQRGVIDAVFTSWAVNKTFKLFEATKYNVHLSGVSTTPFILTANKASWSKLPADMQKIIRDESTIKLAAELGSIWDADDIAGRANAEKSSTTYEPKGADLAKWKSVMQPVIDQWIADMKEKGVDGAKLVADAWALVAKYGKTD
jgi:TRAP-type transport system periplasmic protein